LWGKWQFWQWTDSWSVPGIAGAVDGDVFDGSMAQLENLLLGNTNTPGDYNRDGSVDAADYVMLRKTMGTKVPMYTGADGNGSTIIDAGDVTIWTQNISRVYGSGAGGQAGDALTGSTYSAPEPTGFVLLFTGAIMGLCIRRR
jgi:hypothetical protein